MANYWLPILERDTEMEKSNFTEIQKDQMIKKQIQKMKALFDDVDSGKAEIADQLVTECAFLSVQLQDLRQTINRDGTIEIYQNGPDQYGTKKSPAYDNYLSGVKQLTAIIKQLNLLLPEGDPCEGNALLEFLKQGKK